MISRTNLVIVMWDWLICSLINNSQSGVVTGWRNFCNSRFANTLLRSMALSNPSMACHIPVIIATIGTQCQEELLDSFKPNCIIPTYLQLSKLNSDSTIVQTPIAVFTFLRIFSGKDYTSFGIELQRILYRCSFACTIL